MNLALRNCFAILMTSTLFAGCSDNNSSTQLLQDSPNEDMSAMEDLMSEEETDQEEPNEEEMPPASLSEVNYRATISVDWTTENFPTNYPNNPHFSPILGASHNEQVIFWEANGQPASRGIEVMAEFGGAFEIDDEILAAQENGYSQGLIIGDGISGGTGQVSVEFQTNDTYPLITLVSMLAPSPDWFIGVNSLSLKDEGEWIDQLTVNLPLYDAGTDLGVQYSSSNEDSADDNLAITHLSSQRTDTDFEDGVHFESGRYIATLTLQQIEQEDSSTP